MNWDYQKMVDFWATGGRTNWLLDGKWGLEKEGQRVNGNGELALTDHPRVFGAKLRNPAITTDFSESQLELVTPPLPTVEAAWASLAELQTRAEAGIGAELLWPLSMPPRLPEEEEIPIARFSEETGGKEQEIYRRGLALRYGKKMQMISGIHYNFSFGSRLRDALYQQFGGKRSRRFFTDEVYFAVARNFLRYRWLLIYLFGASPSWDATYDSEIRKQIAKIGRCCPQFGRSIQAYPRYAASLRVSPFGYANQALGNQSGFFNGLESYIQGIRGLMNTRSQEYRSLGLCQNGFQVQLNDRVLQKESEFYAPVRFKQPPQDRESPLEALENRGVLYLEIRTPDLEPFERTGIALTTLHFLQIFMLYCLFEASPALTEREFGRLNQNHHRVALLGRSNRLQLERDDQSRIALPDWGRELFAKLEPVAALLDGVAPGNRYQTVLQQEREKLWDRTLLPSARIERERRLRGESFLEFGVRQARSFKKALEGMENDELQSELCGVGIVDPVVDCRSGAARG